ncbi:MAG: hypothetical protein M1281_07700 [Chloroflexi bacterium]|nr:hypothetical protein [Chloroflexota bacterium]
MRAPAHRPEASPPWFEGHTPTRLRVDLDGPAGAWHLLTEFNWEDTSQEKAINPQDFGLPARTSWHARSFWEGRCLRLPEGKAFTHLIPAHGIVLLAVRQHDPASPAYLGSDLHISQGMEIAGWQASGDGLVVDLALPRSAAGTVDLYLPRPASRVRLDGIALPWTVTGAGRERVFHIPVSFHRSARLEILYQTR